MYLTTQSTVAEKGELSFNSSALAERRQSSMAVSAIFPPRKYKSIFRDLLDMHGHAVNSYGPIIMDHLAFTSAKFGYPLMTVRFDHVSA